MRITRIVIENYRSIKRIAFNPSELTVFVGPNNAGKTNILSAMNFLLGERFPMANALEVTDYYGREPNRDIRIKVSFQQNAQTNPKNVEYISFCSQEPGGPARAWFKTFGFDGERWLSNEIRETCSMVYLDASRNYDSSFGHSKWSLFGRIVRQLGDDFARNVPEARQQALLVHLNDAHEILKTPLYLEFERQVREAFEAQLRGTTHSIRFDFKTFDPLNFYKSLHPTLSEHGMHRSPSETGSGMRNLIVLALFRAYGEVFRGNAIIAIEEPEIYLHPHAQRSLSSLFEVLTGQGAQLFASTHSAAFLSPERADRIVRVRQLLDDEEEICTQIKHVSATNLLTLRRQLHNMPTMTAASMRERYRNICTVEHCEAFFASCVILVEGPTEGAALPIYAKHLSIDFNDLGISVVNANGKGNLDSLFHLYSSMDIPVFTVFDNDRGGEIRDQRLNLVLMRMLGKPEVTIPASGCEPDHFVFEGNYEAAVEADVDAVQPGLYAQLQSAASEEFGSGKPIVARYMARRLTEAGIVPRCVGDLLAAVERIVRPRSAEEEPALLSLRDEMPSIEESDVTALDDDDIPF
jgi:putative ATP-dependent endonuclease of OLD family